MRVNYTIDGVAVPRISAIRALILGGVARDKADAVTLLRSSDCVFSKVGVAGETIRKVERRSE